MAASGAETDVSFAALDYDHGERFQTLPRELGGSGEHVGRDGHAWESRDEGGPGRPPQEIPLPENLPEG